MTRNTAVLSRKPATRSAPGPIAVSTTSSPLCTPWGALRGRLPIRSTAPGTSLYLLVGDVAPVGPGDRRDERAVELRPERLVVVGEGREEDREPPGDVDAIGIPVGVGGRVVGKARLLVDADLVAHLRPGPRRRPSRRWTSPWLWSAVTRISVSFRAPAKSLATSTARSSMIVSITARSQSRGCEYLSISPDSTMSTKPSSGATARRARSAPCRRGRAARVTRGRAPAEELAVEHAVHVAGMEEPEEPPRGRIARRRAHLRVGGGDRVAGGAELRAT